MKPKSTLRSFLLAAGSSLLAVSSASAQATSATWDENNPGNWTTVTNWVGNTAYAEGADNTATFGNSITADRVVTLDTGITIGNITASDTSHNYTISGANILTLDRTDAIAPIIDVTTSGRTLTISSEIAGTDGLTKTGAGTLVLSRASAANTYSGTTTLTAGILEANTGASASLTPGNPFGTSTLQLNGGTLRLRSSGTTGNTADTIQFNNNTTVGGNVTINVDRAGGAGSNKIMQLGTLSIGAFTLTAEDASSAQHDLRFGATTLTGNAVFEVTNNGGGATFMNLTLGAVDESGGARSFTKSGAGTLTLRSVNNNSFSGGFNINGGVVAVDSTTHANAFGASTNVITFTGNGTIHNTNNTYTIGQAVAVNNGVIATFKGANAENTIVNGVVSGSGEIQITSDSSTMSASFANTANTHTGKLWVGTTGNALTFTANSLADSSTGSLKLGTATGANQTISFTLGASTNAPVTLTNRAVELQGTTGSTTLNNDATLDANAFTITPNLTFTTASSGNKTLTLGGTNTGANAFNGSIGNNGSSTTAITKAGAGVWSLGNAANGFTGLITVSAGTLNYASAGGSNGITFSNTTGNATLSYTGSGQTMSGAINASTVTSGTVTLGSFGGGAVNYSNTNSLGSTGSSVKKLVLTGTNTGSNTLAGDWVNNSTGAATVTKNGLGKWVLSGDNAYTGLTTVNEGTLQFANMVALNNNVDTNWTAAKINVKSGATLAVNVDSAGTNGFTAAKIDTLLTNISVANTAAQGLQAGAILGFDTSTATGGTFTQGNAIANSTGSGSFHGAIGVTKLGTGTLELDETNTYTGATTVNAGTLLVSGSIGASAVTVSNAGTILVTDAAASFGSTVAVNNGAILAAGGAAAAGTATVTGATTFNNGSIFSWDINATGASYDKLIAASLAGEVAPGNAVFQIVVADDTFADAFWNSTQTWTNVFTTDGTTAIANWADLFTLSVVDSNFDALTLPGGTSFAISGNTLTWTAVPEPTSALAGLLLGAGLLRRRRA